MKISARDIFYMCLLVIAWIAPYMVEMFLF